MRAEVDAFTKSTGPDMILDALADGTMVAAAMAVENLSGEINGALTRDPPMELTPGDWSVLSQLHAFCTERAYERMALAEQAGSRGRMEQHLRSVQVMDVLYAQAKPNPDAYTIVGHYRRSTAMRDNDHADFRSDWTQRGLLFASGLEAGEPDRGV